MRWDEVLDTMTFTRWHAYEEEWSRAPFVDDLVAGFMGWKPPSQATKPVVKQQQPNFDEFFASVLKQRGRPAGGDKAHG